MLATEVRRAINELLYGRRLKLTAGAVLDVTLIVAPSFTMSSGDKRDPAMHKSTKGKYRGIWA